MKTTPMEGTPSWEPRVEIMVPISREANNPCAIALKASIPYLFAEKIIFFLFKNSFISFSLSKLSFQVSCQSKSIMHSFKGFVNQLHYKILYNFPNRLSFQFMYTVGKIFYNVFGRQDR